MSLKVENLILRLRGLDQNPQADELAGQIEEEARFQANPVDVVHLKDLVDRGNKFLQSIQAPPSLEKTFAVRIFRNVAPVARHLAEGLTREQYRFVDGIVTMVADRENRGRHVTMAEKLIKGLPSTT